MEPVQCLSFKRSSNLGLLPALAKLETSPSICQRQVRPAVRNFG